MKQLNRWAKQRRGTAADREVTRLVQERYRLSRILWSAPLVDLEKPYQRGWYRQFELSQSAHRRADVEQLQELLPFVNRVQYCRQRKFLKTNRRGRKVPAVHRLQRLTIGEILHKKVPERLYRYFNLEGTRIELSATGLEERGGELVRKVRSRSLGLLRIGGEAADHHPATR